MLKGIHSRSSGVEFVRQKLVSILCLMYCINMFDYKYSCMRQRMTQCIHMQNTQLQTVAMSKDNSSVFIVFHVHMFIFLCIFFNPFVFNANFNNRCRRKYTYCRVSSLHSYLFIYNQIDFQIDLDNQIYNNIIFYNQILIKDYVHCVLNNDIYFRV